MHLSDHDLRQFDDTDPAFAARIDAALTERVAAEAEQTLARQAQIGEFGLTVILVEQKLPFARRVDDGFVILDRGRLAARGAMNELGDDLVRQYLNV